MALKTQILTGVGTLVCAASIGFIMQSTDSAGDRYGDVLVSHNAPAAIDGSAAILDVEEITLTSGELDPSFDAPAFEAPSSEAEVVKVAAPQSLPAPAGREEIMTPACEMVATARPVAAAMVKLSLDAACLPNERVTVHHNGMIFTQTTSDTGTLDVTVPALAKDAVFIMAFSNAEGAVAQTTVEELADFDRKVLQWKGTTGFEIHAREFGADYGDKGHIWVGAPGDMANAITGESGFITRLGDASAPQALLAEVYSFPATAIKQAGVVDLTVETEVTDTNCGLEIEAQSLEVLDGGEMKTRNLTLSVPECDAAGNFLVLNNLLQDLKVAGN